MDVFYRANVTDGLFHDEWSMKDGTPQGRKCLDKESLFFDFDFSF